MRKLLQSILLPVLLVLSMTQVAIADNNLAVVEKTLAKIMPKSKPDSVMESVIPGMYEAVFGAQVVYLSGDGRYMVEGDMYDLQKRENLTENKRKTGRVKAVNTLDESTLIVFKSEAGTPKHTITAFTDIDCGYCRKLHDEMAEYNKRGIAIRYAAYPRAGLGSKSYKKAASVWCATEPNRAMTFAKSGAKLEQIEAIEQVKGKDCKGPISKHMQVAREVGVTGTPTLVLTNGKVLPGYVPAARLIQLLNQESSK